MGLFVFDFCKADFFYNFISFFPMIIIIINREFILYENEKIYI